MKTSKTIKKVAADANVLLSATIGKAALKIFTETNISVVTTAFNIEEVKEYLPRLASQYGLEVEILETQLKLLFLKVYEEESYKNYLEEAKKRIGKRDPDDIHLLALALKLDVPIWSNDLDFELAKVEVYPTAKLLKILGF